MLSKILLALVIVILGSIAAQELIKAISPVFPILMLLGLALFVGGGYIKKKQRF